MKDRTKQPPPAGRARRAPRAVMDTIASQGHPLDAAARSELETELGHNFGDVRVHTDATAATAAESVGADAFAVGRDVAFAAGRYEPGTLRGRVLLAHELTHVAQQGQRKADATNELTVAPGGDAVEAEADLAAVAHAATAAPAYLNAALARGTGADPRRAQALADFRRAHPDSLLDGYRSRLAEPRVTGTAKQSSPLLEVRRAACGRSSERHESREELTRDLPGDDEMVSQVLAFFYPDLTPPAQLNDQLRQLAAVMLAEAIRGSRAMDYVPRPPARPSVGWLFTEAVKIAWRRGRDEGIYNAVRVTVARAHRSEYELAKEGI